VSGEGGDEEEDAASVYRYVYPNEQTVRTRCQAREQDAVSMHGSTGTLSSHIADGVHGPAARS